MKACHFKQFEVDIAKMDLVSAKLGYGIQLSRLIFRTLWSQRQFLISWACWPASYWSYPRRLTPLKMTCLHLQAFMQTKVIYDFSLFLLFKKADVYLNWEFWPQVCGLNHWDNILPNMFLRTILKFFQHISRFLGSLLKKLENMIRSSLHFRLKPTKWELHPQAIHSSHSDFVRKSSSHDEFRSRYERLPLHARFSQSSLTCPDTDLWVALWGRHFTRKDYKRL